MLKGAQKQMIVIRTGDSRYFDEAYFVLRREISGGREAQNDMIREANRILRQNEPEARARGERRRGRGWLAFLGGLLSGAAIAVGIVLLLLL